MAAPVVIKVYEPGTPGYDEWDGVQVVYSFAPYYDPNNVITFRGETGTPVPNPDNKMIIAYPDSGYYVYGGTGIDTWSLLDYMTFLQVKGQPPTDPLGFELDERGLPADSRKWEKETESYYFTDASGCVWVSDFRVGWEPYIGGGMLIDHSDLFTEDE